MSVSAKVIALNVLQPFWASVIVYNTGLTLVKVSILLQFLQFFVGTTIRRIAWGVLSIVAAYGLWTFLGSVFACTPIAFFWDRNIPGGHCLDLLVVWFSNASFNIVTDFIICILPIPVLKTLRLPKKQKYILTVVFMLGGL
jgi:hypothetical protein